MKTISKKCGVWRATSDGAQPEPSRRASRVTRRARAFTLVELLVVISVIAVLAALTIPGLGVVKKRQYINTAQAEMQRIETALENYKAKYGVYPPGNQITPTNSYAPMDRSEFSQLYYELSGTTRVTNGGTGYFSTLDGSSQIKITDVNIAYGVSGFINCSNGIGEDAVSPKNFLSGLTAKQINTQVSNNLVNTAMLVTSVGGPDVNYQPLSPAGVNVPGLNPFRYVYPGVNNPNSYDLWVQLSIGSSFSGINIFQATNKYLICNWTKSVQKNSPLP
jgi:prepilin-type N-terminal cleavage/methylation domain-containing protein